jgi:hypothetical protein
MLFVLLWYAFVLKELRKKVRIEPLIKRYKIGKAKKIFLAMVLHDYLAYNAASPLTLVPIS